MREMTSYLATGLAEGFQEGTEKEKKEKAYTVKMLV